MHLTPCVAVCRLNTEEHRQKHCWKDLADTPKTAKQFKGLIIQAEESLY